MVVSGCYVPANTRSQELGSEPSRVLTYFATCKVLLAVVDPMGYHIPIMTTPVVNQILRPLIYGPQPVDPREYMDLQVSAVRH